MTSDPFKFWRDLEKQNVMSDDLKRFLDIVWTQRVQHGIDKHTKEPVSVVNAKAVRAYNVYSRGGKAPGYDLQQTCDFLTELAALPRVPELQTGPGTPLGKLVIASYGGQAAPSGFVSLPALEFRRLVEDAQNWPDLARCLSKVFFHFRKVLGGATQRIYLHINVIRGPQVMAYLLHHVYPLAGVSNLKVAPPSADERYDSIVIYCANEATIEAALVKISEYQKGHRGLFEHGSPRLLRVIEEYRGVKLVGVATGAEPRFDVTEQNGTLVRLNRTSSFGTVRGVIIDYCLRQTVKNGGGKDNFFAMVVRVFRAAGIDPRKPYLG